jgi:hypothetical protein
VFGALKPQGSCREPAQLRVENAEQPVRCLLIAAAKHGHQLRLGLDSQLPKIRSIPGIILRTFHDLRPARRSLLVRISNQSPQGYAATSGLEILREA